VQDIVSGNGSLKGFVLGENVRRALLVVRGFGLLIGRFSNFNQICDVLLQGVPLNIHSSQVTDKVRN
jgi:hypothetical protein